MISPALGDRLSRIGADPDGTVRPDLYVFNVRFDTDLK
jgi:hypothetical protein